LSTVLLLRIGKDLRDFQDVSTNCMNYLREYFYHLPTFLSIRPRKYYEYSYLTPERLVVLVTAQVSIRE